MFEQKFRFLITIMIFLSCSFALTSERVVLKNGQCIAIKNSEIIRPYHNQHVQNYENIICDYQCMKNDKEFEIINGSFEQERDQVDECEGAYRPFYPQLAQSDELRIWAKHNSISLMKLIDNKFKNELRTMGLILLSTKSRITSEAGGILVKISGDSDEAKQLLEYYIDILNSGQFKSGRFQTVDQWVLNYLSHFVKEKL